MRATTRIAAAGLGLVLCRGATALATEWVTPLADTFHVANQITECVATNVGNAPATITIGLFDTGGSLITPTLDSCNGAPLFPGLSCFIHGDPGPAWCRATTSSPRVHVALEVWDLDTDRLQVMFPATKP